MSTLLDITTALNSTTLRTRCEGAILKNAMGISRESRLTPHHDERRSLALRALRVGISWPDWQRFVVSDGVVIAKAAAPDTLTDGEVESLVLTIWNLVAGIDPEDVA